MALKESSLIVQAMTILEDFTPIKPLTGLPDGPTPGRNDKGLTDIDGNAMSIGGLFHLNHNQVLLLLIIGLAYSVFKMIVG